MGKQSKPTRDEARAKDDGNDVEGHRQSALPGLPGTGGDSLLPGLPGTGGDSLLRRPSGGGEATGEDDTDGDRLH
jgi:hypothetical protein